MGGELRASGPGGADRRRDEERSIGADPRRHPRASMTATLSRGRLHRVARRGRQRPGPPAVRYRAERSRRLVRAKTLDARRRPGAHLAGHSDALPGPGVSGGRVVPRHRPARLGEEAALRRHLSDVYQDLIRLRRNSDGRSRGLAGHHVNVFHANDRDKVIAFHRWDRGGPGDDVVVVLNLANRAYDSYTIGFPRGGAWRVRFNSDWSGYSPDFGNRLGYDTVADPGLLRRPGFSRQSRPRTLRRAHPDAGELRLLRDAGKGRRQDRFTRE